MIKYIFKVCLSYLYTYWFLLPNYEDYESWILWFIPTRGSFWFLSVVGTGRVMIICKELTESVGTLKPLPFDSLRVFGHGEFQQNHVSKQSDGADPHSWKFTGVMGFVRFANHVSSEMIRTYKTCFAASYAEEEGDNMCISILELLHHYWGLSCIYNKFIRLKCLYYCIAISGSPSMWWHFSC